MMFIHCKVLVLTAIILPLLMEGQTQHSPCTNVQVQVETLNGSYQSVTDNTTYIYRPVNAKNLTMRCKCANGNGIPSWILPDRQLSYSCSNQSNGICISNQNKWQQITFSLVEKRFMGLYHCYSDTSPHQVGFEFYVFDVPVIKQPQRDSKISLGSSNATLHCKAAGYGSLKYYWERKDSGKWITVGNSNMTSYNARTSGQYRCNVTNEAGSVTSPVITVYGKPRVIPLPSQILGVLGKQLQITCNATNDKDAPHDLMFTWMTPDGVDHNIKMINEDDDHTASSTLYISILARSDGGTYKCYVTNNNVSSASVVVTSTTVIVEERPSQPVNFRAIDNDETSLLLIWTNPLMYNGKIDYYTVFCSDGKLMKTVNVFNFTGLYILKNLTPSTQYSLYVRAMRLIGVNEEILEGNSSVMITVTTTSKGSEHNNDDSDSCGMVMVKVLVVLLALSLTCCLSLLIIVITLYKKNTKLQDGTKSTNKKLRCTDETVRSNSKTIMSTDEMLKSSNEKSIALNPVYASIMTSKSADDTINNPMYVSVWK